MVEAFVIVIGLALSGLLALVHVLFLASTGWLWVFSPLIIAFIVILGFLVSDLTEARG